jgi:uncharacterized phage-associated protein
MPRKKKPITAEEFAAWREDPVTQVVLKAHADMAEIQKAAWLAASWEGGDVNPVLLATLKTRAEAYSAIGECTFEDIVGGEDA